MAEPGGRATCDALAILDVGTTSTRAFVIGLHGTVLGAAREPNRLAGVLDRPVAVPADVEGSTVGALILGGVALGLLPDLDHGSAIVKVRAAGAAGGSGPGGRRPGLRALPPAGRPAPSGVPGAGRAPGGIYGPGAMMEG